MFGVNVSGFHVFDNIVDVANEVDVARLKTKLPEGKPTDDVASTFILFPINKQNVILPLIGGLTSTTLTVLVTGVADNPPLSVTSYTTL